MNSPVSSGQTSQDQSLLLVRVVDSIWGLESFSDPIALLQRVNEHEFNSNFIAVRVLQAIKNFSQWQKLLFASDEGSTG